MIASLKYAAAIALLALSGCANVSADGYLFERAEYARRSVALEVVTHDDLRTLQLVAEGHGATVERDRVLHAFGIISPDRKMCTIHVVEPTSNYRPEWLGHEIAHCIWGRWHK